MTETVRVASHPARWDQRTSTLLGDWHVRARAAQFGHQTCSAKTRRLYLLLAVPVVALTTLVGTSVFATFNETPSRLAKVGAASPQIGDKVWQESFAVAEEAIKMWRRGELDLDAVTEASTIARSSPP